MAKRTVPEINASSMADISFLLLIFFLVTTSMATNKGLSRKLPPPLPKDQVQQDIKMEKRNVLVILINSKNQLLVGGQPLELGELRQKTKEFIKNEFNDPRLPALTAMNIPLLGTMNVTKDHVISLQNDRGTSYQIYLEVQNELVAAYNDLREDLAKEKFGVHFSDLGEESAEAKAIQKVYPMKISEAEPKNYGGKK
jgi:biopolymer transport protein ExbD